MMRCRLQVVLLVLDKKQKADKEYEQVSVYYDPDGNEEQ
jgi:hypothetical protein